MLSTIMVCLVGGVAFAALAVILTRSKGNTLKDVLNSDAFKNKPPESLKLEFDQLQNKFKASAQIPVVALYVISALVALGVPTLMILHPSLPSKPDCEDGEVTLTGKIIKSVEKNVYLVPTELRIEPSGFFRIPLKKNDPKRDYNIESESYSPVTLNVEYGKKDQKLYVNWNNVVEDTLVIDTLRNTAKLASPIQLAPRAVMVVSNKVTASPETASAPGPQKFQAFDP
jgi:hypothetical protein